MYPNLKQKLKMKHNWTQYIQPQLYSDHSSIENFSYLHESQDDRKLFQFFTIPIEIVDILLE